MVVALMLERHWKRVEAFTRGLAKLFGVVVVSPTYRLALKYPFPQGINDTWDAFKWMAANASNLGATLSEGFILPGGSSGGNLSVFLSSLDLRILSLPRLERGIIR